MSLSKEAKFKKFLKLYKEHGLPYVCRELNINSDEYYRLLELAKIKGG